jgi:hypothetical protein
MRNVLVNTLCRQSAEVLVLDQVVRVVTTVRGKCAKACDCDGIWGGGGECGCGLDARGSGYGLVMWLALPNLIINV